MTKDYNNISEIFSNFVKLHKETLNILYKLNESVITNDNYVSFISVDGNEYKFPSYTSLLNKIIAIEKEVTTLNDIRNKEFNIPVFNNYLITEDKKIDSIIIPKNFEMKPNWFFENLMNPLLYVSVDISNKINNQSKFIIAKRLILKLDTIEKLNLFNEHFNNKNNLIYDDVVKLLNNNFINYDIDEDVYTLPPLTLNKSGKFIITNIKPESIDNGVYMSVRKYTFDTLKYKDNKLNSEVILKVGDILYNQNNEFIVLGTDDITNEIKLGLKSSNKILNINDELLIGNSLEGLKNFHITVSNNEANIVFLKAVDPYYHTTSNSYGDGFAFKTSDLKTFDNISFNDYYEKYVNDFGNALKILIDENIKPLTNISVKAPILNKENFKTILLNKHLFNNIETEKLNTLISNKSFNENKLNKEYEKLNNTTNQEEIDLIYVNILQIKEIIKKINNEILINKNNISKFNYEPKYNIKGFITFEKSEIPITHFIINYRYLSVNNETIDDNIIIKDVNNDNITAMFSKWVEIQSPIRNRKKNEISEKYEWEEINYTDSNIVNINEISLPIKPGEKIEIRVRSVFDVGLKNSIKSDWSNILNLQIDDSEIINIENISSLIEEIKYLSLKIEIEDCCIKNSNDISIIRNEFNKLREDYDKITKPSAIAAFNELFPDSKIEGNDLIIYRCPPTPEI